MSEQSAWDAAVNDLCRRIKTANPLTVGVGVGTFFKDVPVPNKWWQKKKPSEKVRYLSILILDRPPPTEEWVALSGAGDPRQMQYDLVRGKVSGVIRGWSMETGLSADWHFAPTAYVEPAATATIPPQMLAHLGKNSKLNKGHRR